VRSCGYILVVDDDDDYRDLVVEVLARIELEVRGAKRGEEALAWAVDERPALVLLDVRLPRMSGYVVCRELRERFGDDLPIVFVSGERTEAFDRVAGLLLGANDYITKPFDPDELLARVQTQLRAFGDPRPVGVNGGDRTPTRFNLTGRERQVLSLLAQGRGQGEIADLLFISPKTVGSHLQHVLTKLGVHSRAHAVAVAHRERLVDVDVDAHALL
jgi:DNA-binding NarL/FixJ family response regulator